MGFHVTRYSGGPGVEAALTAVEQQQVTDIRFVAQEEQLADPLFPARLWDVAEKCRGGTFHGVEYLGTKTRESY